VLIAEKYVADPEIIAEIGDFNSSSCMAAAPIYEKANMALSIASRGYVLQTGEIVLYDSARELLNNPLMQKAYLGVA
jgi:branched-chain amino acid transport system ATP-binding protein